VQRGLPFSTSVDRVAEWVKVVVISRPESVIVQTLNHLNRNINTPFCIAENDPNQRG
jgi:hypothetical protein